MNEKPEGYFCILCFVMHSVARNRELSISAGGHNISVLTCQLEKQTAAPPRGGLLEDLMVVEAQMRSARSLSAFHPGVIMSCWTRVGRYRPSFVVAFISSARWHGGVDERCVLKGYCGAQTSGGAGRRNTRLLRGGDLVA